MKIGVLSDTHGQVAITVEAIRLLTDQGAEHVVHCGDLGEVGRSCLPVLKLLPHGRSSFVFGNTDTDLEAARMYASQHEINCLGYAGIIELDHKRVAVTHGHDQALVMDILLLDPLPDFLLLGHSHIPSEQVGLRPRRINPGSVVAPRGGSNPGVVIYDTIRNCVQRWALSHSS